MLFCEKELNFGSNTCSELLFTKKGLLDSHPGTVFYGAVLGRERHHLIMEIIEKTCSCFGHTNIDITDDLIARTKIEIDKAIADGVRIFLFGGRSDFDDLCYDLVTEKKSEDPLLGIKRVFCFPLDKQIRKPPWWYKRKDYEALECPTKDFDYWYTSIYYRNLAMIDQSNLVLFCVEERENSGAYKTYKYAVKKHKHIVNLFT